MNNKTKSHHHDSALPSSTVAKVEPVLAAEFKGRIMAATTDPKPIAEELAVGTNEKDDTQVTMPVTRPEVLSVVAELKVVTKNNVDEILKTCIAKICKERRAKIIETVALKFEDALKRSYVDTNGGFENGNV